MYCAGWTSGLLFITALNVQAETNQYEQTGLINDVNSFLELYSDWEYFKNKATCTGEEDQEILNISSTLTVAKRLSQAIFGIKHVHPQECYKGQCSSQYAEILKTFNGSLVHGLNRINFEGNSEAFVAISNESILSGLFTFLQTGLTWVGQYDTAGNVAANTFQVVRSDTNGRSTLAFGTGLNLSSLKNESSPHQFCIYSKSKRTFGILACGSMVDGFVPVDMADVQLEMEQTVWPILKIKSCLESIHAPWMFRPILPEQDLDSTPKLIKVLSTFILMSASNQNRKPGTAFRNKAAESEYISLLNEGPQKYNQTFSENLDLFCHLIGPNYEDQEFKDFKTKSGIIKHGLIAHPGSGGRWLLCSLSLTNIFWSGAMTAVGYAKGNAGIVHGHHQSMNMYTKPFYGRPRTTESLSWRMTDLLDYPGGILLLIRDPLSATLAFWNHIAASADESDYNFQGENRNVEKEMKTKKFWEFVKRELDLWFQVSAEVLSLAPKVHVVFYEDMKTNTVAEVEKIHHFFHFPLNERRLKCVGAITHVITKRNQNRFRAGRQHFSDLVLDQAEGLMDALDEILIERGFNRLPRKKYLK